MRAILLVIIILGSFCASFAQSKIELENSGIISIEALKSVVDTLSSPFFEGRSAGTLGEIRSADYLSEKFKSLGIFPTPCNSHYIQEFPLKNRSGYSKHVTVNQRRFLFGTDYFYVETANDTLFKPDSLIFAGYGIQTEQYDDFEGHDVSGKFIIFFNGTPSGRRDLNEWNYNWKLKFRSIYKLKPAAVVIISENISALRDSLSSPIKSFEFINLCKGPASIPVLFVSEEMSPFFLPEAEQSKLMSTKKRIDRGGKPSAFVFRTDAELFFSSNTRELTGMNVIGFLPGAKRKHKGALIISAHYDHLGIRKEELYPGADDNASGVSVMLEIARQFSLSIQNGELPLRDIYFLASGAEEKGLQGADYFLNYSTCSNIEYSTNLNIDMIGRTDASYDSLGLSNYLYIITDTTKYVELILQNEKLNSDSLRLDLKYCNPLHPLNLMRRNDQFHFLEKGIPSLFYFSGIHDDYHRPEDTSDKIMYEPLKNRASLIFRFARSLAF
ncbi:MAG: hypothetical protein DWQ44_05165 [Bacteroidetes bacterium]|nr:MAG: hypothetical protein DWQ33_11810 [Bacteroidota bacterium]REK00766.1 MAG: hypothetical protein DWQ39_11485 [Bacteroidota bacterium]REK35014.1 MAG: hypothetical protein DWQ44_05165 [Bacteroidota bacterium]REK48188.1 MAG: hypothetical protein DWQ48_10180 [Bacteroidota bacterium]